MDDGSEAETAASLHTMSDAAQTVNSATFTDPNSMYPHPQSLRSPIGIARERNPEEDVAIQYVTAKAGELRFTKICENCQRFCEIRNFSNRFFAKFLRLQRCKRMQIL